MQDGQAQYASPFLIEVEAATRHVEDDPKQAYWGEVNEQGNNLISQEIAAFIPPQTSLLKLVMH